MMTTQKSQLIAGVLLTAVVCAASTAFVVTVPAAQDKVEPKAATELTPEEKRGQAIFQRGESASGQPIATFIGETEVRASKLTCAGCHASAGEGEQVGGIASSNNLAWQHLTKESGHTHAGERKHRAFTEATFARAVTGGVDPDGNHLSTAMPRFRMSAEDMAALIAYLKRIETEKKQPPRPPDGSRQNDME